MKSEYRLCLSKCRVEDFPTEPSRACRRPFYVSPVIGTRLSCVSQYICSSSTGGMLPIGMPGRQILSTVVAVMNERPGDPPWPQSLFTGVESELGAH